MKTKHWGVFGSADIFKCFKGFPVQNVKNISLFLRKVSRRQKWARKKNMQSLEYSFTGNNLKNKP